MECLSIMHRTYCSPSLNHQIVVWELDWWIPIPTRIILCMRPANERWCCNVTLSLIGWVHTQNDSCSKVGYWWDIWLYKHRATDCNCYCAWSNRPGWQQCKQCWSNIWSKVLFSSCPNIRKQPQNMFRMVNMSTTGLCFFSPSPPPQKIDNG